MQARTRQPACPWQRQRSTGNSTGPAHSCVKQMVATRICPRPTGRHGTPSGCSRTSSGLLHVPHLQTSGCCRFGQRSTSVAPQAPTKRDRVAPHRGVGISSWFPGRVPIGPREPDNEG
jgi:hypothetical protein